MSIHIVKNIGRFDQILRIGISLSLIYIGLIDEQIIPDPLSSYIIGGIGVLNLIIALVRFCPLYVATGINTSSRDDI
jgi:Inner membrane protein YgaP-like, transmembrane domain